MNANVIEVENLVKVYGRRPAVKDVSFHVKHGEIFGFLGPNGVGKTTTIKILTGIYRASSGKCRIFGSDVCGSNSPIHSRTGVVFEEANFYERLSGLANLNFYASLYGIKSDRVLALLKEFGLEDSRGKPVGTYSKGMKQRLSICRALLHEPELLILDEPTSGLDPGSTAQIRDLIRRWKSAGQTIMLSTHAMEEADELCDRVAFINDGKIIVVDTPSNLKYKYGRPVLTVEVDCRQNPTGVESLRELAIGGEVHHLDDAVVTVNVPLDPLDPGSSVSSVSRHGKVIALHSQEASLRDVFHHVIKRVES